MSYQAVIARIHTRHLEGSDNIQLGTCLGYQVIIGNDVQDGELGVFFEAGGQLSEEFCQVHDLVRRKDENGDRAGGYFEANRRVHAIKMRGVRSDGFWCPIRFVEYCLKTESMLVEGYQFTELQGHPICNKYETKATRMAAAQGRKAKRGETQMFRKQFDMEQFKRSVQLIPDGAVIYVTEKLHGTSFRYGRVLDEVDDRRWYDRLLRKQRTRKEWVYLNGSKNVILEKSGPEYRGFYSDETFRSNLTKDIVLHKGEVLYGEIVGYTGSGVPIMSPQSTKGLKDKEVSKRWGDEVRYTYGCESGEARVFIYRITRVNEDGVVTELSWPQVKMRCEELGLRRVPEIACIINDEAANLEQTVKFLTSGKDEEGLASTLDNHLREGVVVRAESEYGTLFLKNKGWLFYVLEGVLKEQEDYVDREESA